MSARRILILSVVGLALGGGWYAFRPERAFLDRRVDEPSPNAAAAFLWGQFVPRAHEGRGWVEVLELAGGGRIVRLSNFETRDGPDLALYLVGSPEVANNQDLEKSGYLSLGSLKGNVGSQNYVVPAGTDLARYHAVSVWCRRLHVNFTTATLRPSAPAGS